MKLKDEEECLVEGVVKRGRDFEALKNKEKSDELSEKPYLVCALVLILLCGFWTGMSMSIARRGEEGRRSVVRFSGTFFDWVSELRGPSAVLGSRVLVVLTASASIADSWEECPQSSITNSSSESRDSAAILQGNKDDQLASIQNYLKIKTNEPPGFLSRGLRLCSWFTLYIWRGRYTRWNRRRRGHISWPELPRLGLDGFLIRRYGARSQLSCRRRSFKSSIRHLFRWRHLCIFRFLLFRWRCCRFLGFRRWSKIVVVWTSNQNVDEKKKLTSIASWPSYVVPKSFVLVLS